MWIYRDRFGIAAQAVRLDCCKIQDTCSPLTRIRRFVCVLTASKGVVSGSGVSIAVGKDPDTYGVRMHEAVEVLDGAIRWAFKERGAI